MMPVIVLTYTADPTQFKKSNTHLSIFFEIYALAVFIIRLIGAENDLIFRSFVTSILTN